MVYNVNPSEVLTADKKAMVVDSYATWKISDVTTFIRTVGNTNEMQKRIDASVYSVIKNIMGELQQNQIIADTEELRDSLNDQITAKVSAQLAPYGVQVGAIEIKKYDLPTDNTEAVYNRMISERAQMAASYKADGEYEASIIRNNTDKEVGIMIGSAKADAQRIRGEGEAEYMRILAELYDTDEKADFYLYVRSLEALKTALTGDKTLVLGPDSPVFHILNDVAADYSSASGVLPSP